MQIETLTFTRGSGWSVQPFPALDSANTLVLVFGASSFVDDPAPLEALEAAYPNSQVLGCSTSGEIFGNVLADDSLSVAIARFDSSTLAAASATVANSHDSFGAGKSLAEQLSGDDLKAILVLSDGLGVNGSELVKGFNSALPESVIVTGGLAGDGDRFKKTWVVDGGTPVSGLVSAVAIYGDSVHVTHGSKGGWDIFGPQRVVTKSRDNVLYELDGKPALQIYKQYLGERAAGLPATALLFPLALRANVDDDKILVRTVLSVDENEQTMTFAGNIPQGHMAQLMRANFERLIEGAAAAGVQSARKPTTADGQTLAVAISCVGRRLILGERAEEEIEAVLAGLPDRTSQIGFYSYGEISPYATGHCDLHNQTMTITTITES